MQISYNDYYTCMCVQPYKGRHHSKSIQNKISISSFFIKIFKISKGQDRLALELHMIPFWEHVNVFLRASLKVGSSTSDSARTTPYIRWI